MALFNSLMTGPNPCLEGSNILSNFEGHVNRHFFYRLTSRIQETFTNYKKRLIIYQTKARTPKLAEILPNNAQTIEPLQEKKREHLFKVIKRFQWTAFARQVQTTYNRKLRAGKTHVSVNTNKQYNTRTHRTNVLQTSYILNIYLIIMASINQIR